MTVVGEAIFLDSVVFELKRLLSWSIKYFPIIREVVEKLHRCLDESS